MVHLEKKQHSHLPTHFLAPVNAKLILNNEDTRVIQYWTTLVKETAGHETGTANIAYQSSI